MSSFCILDEFILLESESEGQASVIRGLTSVKLGLIAVKTGLTGVRFLDSDGLRFVFCISVRCSVMLFGLFLLRLGNVSA